MRKASHVHGLQVLSLDCNPVETNRAASSSADRSLKLWDLHQGRCIQDFVDVHKTCNSLCFGSEGQVRTGLAILNTSTSLIASHMHCWSGPFSSNLFSRETCKCGVFSDSS